MSTQSSVCLHEFNMTRPTEALTSMSTAFLSSFRVPTTTRKFFPDLRTREPQRRTRSLTCAADISNPESSYQTGKIRTKLRVFVEQNFIAGETITLNPYELSHLKARRARNGDILLLFNNEGCTATALLQQSQAVVLQVSHAQSSAPSIFAIIGIPKSSSRTDWIVEKLTELGISTITFAITARTTTRPSDAKLQRWHRLAVAASKQCLRTKVPELSVQPFNFVLSEVQQHQAPLLFCSGGRPIFSEQCFALVRKSSSALLLIGPEGGFDDNEIDSLVNAGATKVGLGDSRLRVETAAIVATGCVRQMLAHTPYYDYQEHK